VLYGIVSNANGDRRIASNPAGGVKLPPIVKKPHKDLTSEQFHAPAREASRYRALVLLLSTAGLLWGEAVGYRRAGAGGQPYSSATGSHRPVPVENSGRGRHLGPRSHRSDGHSGPGSAAGSSP
jgi:hypothetical protein